MAGPAPCPAASLLGFAVATLVMAAPVTFQAVCESPSDCDGDTDSLIELTFDESRIVPGGTFESRPTLGFNVFPDFSFTIASSVGDGFTFSGGIADLGQTGQGVNLTFDTDGNLTAIRDFNEGAFIFNSVTTGPGRFDFSASQVVTTRRDDAGAGDGTVDFDDIEVSWQRVDTVIPLPAGMPLLLSALAAVAFLRRRSLRCAD